MRANIRAFKDKVFGLIVLPWLLYLWRHRNISASSHSCIKVSHPLTRSYFFWHHKSNNYGIFYSAELWYDALLDVTLCYLV